MAKRRRLAQAENGVQEPLFQHADDAATTANAYSGYKPPVDLEHAADEPPGNLRAEIVVVRTLLADALKMDLAPDERARIISQLMAALVRLVRENRFVDGTPVDKVRHDMEELLQDKDIGMAAARDAAMATEGENHGSNDR